MKNVLYGALGFLGMMVVCCVGVVVGAGMVSGENGRRAAQGGTAVSQPVLTLSDQQGAPTAVLPVAQVRSSQPNVAAAELAALEAYGKALEPILRAGGEIAERDGAILEASEENPAALCNGRSPHPTLEADARAMADLAAQLARVPPPADVEKGIHNPLVDSMTLWSEALENINQSCTADNEIEAGLHRLGAGLQLGGAMLNFGVAVENFRWLLLQNGLEALGEALGQ